MYTPLHSTRLYEQVVNQIREQILTDQLKDGDKLPTERELAQRLGVSRTVVREALRSLAKEGLVEVRHGRGTYIINLTSQVLSKSLDLMLTIERADKSAELLEIREIFEPSIAALAASRATDDDLAALRAAVERMDASMEDVQGYTSADHSFHVALAVATHNFIIPTLLNPIVDLLNSQREKIFHVQNGPQSGQVHHKRILDAVGSRDPEAAREAMITHLRQVREHAREVNEQKPSPNGRDDNSEAAPDPD